MSDTCACGKVLDVQVLEARQRRVLIVVLGINLLTFVLMAFAAWYSDSSSLWSGSLDNLGDALTYAASLAVVGAGLRAKAWVALLKGVFILLAALTVAAQILWRLTEASGRTLVRRHGHGRIAQLGGQHRLPLAVDAVSARRCQHGFRLGVLAQ